MTQNGQKWPLMSHKFSGFFFPKSKKLNKKKIVFYVVDFDSIKI